MQLNVIDASDIYIKLQNQVDKCNKEINNINQ